MFCSTKSPVADADSLAEYPPWLSFKRQLGGRYGGYRHAKNATGPAVRTTALVIFRVALDPGKPPPLAEPRLRSQEKSTKPNKHDLEEKRRLSLLYNEVVKQIIRQNAARRNRSQSVREATFDANPSGSSPDAIMVLGGTSRREDGITQRRLDRLAENTPIGELRCSAGTMTPEMKSRLSRVPRPAPLTMPPGDRLPEAGHQLLLVDTAMKRMTATAPTTAE
ncbi:hypothetical protein B0T14DRAFT_310349 [Immersiella caudata]|uniref:Uncharacterized protein n=1 Tax=Immersiella caudata TaxID=314043 RepID=A0AA39WFQ3_9PEZI|nr:hypothetical protein B0T14DRAFT_310349 [Immersiella caudata]